ncbi:tryptophan halogenase family protein [Thalassotalea profundi]|uniref:Tryptophan halogenase n=1 Tax=Thalassotalea profundi TaxID=2036687 RepID=A0ABQ3II76_9GAMM|nr:tryptophan halogenase family protein [Thalassotalea profundi]GHE83437.1 tryptophan halogenase [Thalassotalea profundi]
MTNNKKINSIVIVGGGTAGWMTAAALSQHFKEKNVNITLVESSQLGTIGVGEATIPTLRRFYQKLGFSDLEVLKSTAATCKLGIEFKDWYKIDTTFIHPFGLYGQGTKDVDFHHYWLRYTLNGGQQPLTDFSLGVRLANENKFTFPKDKPESQLDIFDWALHFDAALFAKLMREYSLKNNVTLIDNKIVDVTLDSHGDINSLVFDDKTTHHSDLFIDCSGFRALLIEEALNTGYEDWSQWLVCDRAVAVQSKSVDAPPPRTISTAVKAGWQWRIPLQHRQGNGYVYSSRYTSDEEAKACLLANVEGEILHEPRMFTFTPGRRKQAWSKNCIAIGLSSGFLEPLESTSIALVETAIEKVIQSFDSTSYNQETITRFNEVTTMEYERVRDFIILHYKANQRNDSPLWQYCREMKLPQLLAEKLERYQNNGEILRYPFEIFGKDSWLAIFNGFAITPKTYNARADNMPLDYLNSNLSFMSKKVKESAKNAPSHEYFLKEYCQFIND